MTALISPGGDCVTVYWINRADSGDDLGDAITCWVFDVALAYAIHVRTPGSLHGSVVAVGEGAIALLGDKGAGKSTLTAAFVAAGWRMLADDHLVTSWPGEICLAQPGTPRLHLWPASLPVLGNVRVDPVYAFSSLEKIRLDVGQLSWQGVSQFQPSPLPLRAIYILQPRQSSLTTPAIQPLALNAAIHHLLLKRYSAIPISNEYASAELQALARLAQAVPVRRLQRPDGLESLPGVVKAICEDCGLDAR